MPCELLAYHGYPPSRPYPCALCHSNFLNEITTQFAATPKMILTNNAVKKISRGFSQSLHKYGHDLPNYKSLCITKIWFRQKRLFSHLQHTAHFKYEIRVPQYLLANVILTTTGLINHRTSSWRRKLSLFFIFIPTHYSCFLLENLDVRLWFKTTHLIYLNLLHMPSRASF